MKLLEEMMKGMGGGGGLDGGGDVSEEQVLRTSLRPACGATSCHSTLSTANVRARMCVYGAARSSRFVFELMFVLFLRSHLFHRRPLE